MTTSKLSFVPKAVMSAPQRLGRFEVTEDLLRDGWPRMLNVFKDLVVVETTHHFDRRTVEYLAYSVHFDELPDGVAAPFYTATVLTDKTVTWARSSSNA